MFTSYTTSLHLCLNSLLYVVQAHLHWFAFQTWRESEGWVAGGSLVHSASAWRVETCDGSATLHFDSLDTVWLKWILLQASRMQWIMCHLNAYLSSMFSCSLSCMTLSCVIFSWLLGSSFNLFAWFIYSAEKKKKSISAFYKPHHPCITGMRTKDGEIHFSCINTFGVRSSSICISGTELNDNLKGWKYKAWGQPEWKATWNSCCLQVYSRERLWMLCTIWH